MLLGKNISKLAALRPSKDDPDWLKKGRQAMALHTMPTPEDPKKGN